MKSYPLLLNNGLEYIYDTWINIAHTECNNLVNDLNLPIKDWIKSKSVLSVS